MNASRYHIGKPPRAWKHYRKSYVSHDSVKMILSLHKLETQLRKEIAETQVTHWTPAQIKARFG